MQNKKRMMTGTLTGLAVLALAGSGLKVWAEQIEQEIKVALPAEQVIASIRTAVAAKPGRVLEVESENEKGRILCEVTVQTDDGKIYEVEVDVATNKTVEIELEDGNDD